MGIPSFYRWLLERYPRAVIDVIEEPPSFINGVQLPLDSSAPNPNGFEFDNLYLDMNGIIHPCFHPEGQPAPKSYEEVFKAVFKYIDKLFWLVRPRKLLYMAIDGVAPRAKMNQQRSRRFKAAKEAADAAAGAEGMIKETEVQNKDNMDSNVITPGTEFMASLASALQYYIRLRVNSDPGWRGIKVILSDANVVGEGEHKIMSYIRLQRNLKGFDPNTRHCLYGLDADLIMLALATHEIHFSILREDVSKNQRHTRNAQIGKGFAQNRQFDIDEYLSKQEFQFFNVWILREYLMHDMKISNSTVKGDLERLLDDFVFMCLLVGNDFLPHVPSLEISEGAIDLLMTVYKREFVQMGGYLTESFKVNLDRVEYFIQAVGSNENAIFRRRVQVQKNRGIHPGPIDSQRGSASQRLGPSKHKMVDNFWSSIDRGENPTCSRAKRSQSTSTAATLDGANKTVDDIQLGEEGWKERYYIQKFEAKTEDEREKIRKHAVLKYIEGMCWVMHYYYEGVCSWQWFYPYHYAPFASDFYDLEHCKIHFTPGEPFKPFDQLMAVLPAASAHALPLCYRELMTDPSSSILDFYPADFELDMNGKRFEWQAVCKLPFIEESRLLAEIAKVEHNLTDEEKRRNSFGMDVLFLHISHPLAADIVVFYERNKDHPKLAKGKVKRSINPKLSGGMNGMLYVSDKPVWPLEICSPVGDMEKVTMNKVISLFYKYPAIHPHIPRPPKGVVMPRVSIMKVDIAPAALLWHEQSTVFGRKHSGRPVPKSISGPRLAMLAHRLLVKCYVEERKETVEPAVLNGLVAVDDPKSATRPDSEGTVEEKNSYDVTCTSVTRAEKEGALAVSVTKIGKVESTHSAATEKRRKTGDLSAFDGHISIDESITPILQNSIKTSEPEKAESDAVATGSVKSKGKRKRRAASGKSHEHVEPAELTPIVVDTPSSPTWETSNEVVHEKNMNNDSSCNAARCQKKEGGASHSNEAACENMENILDPPVHGHIAINALSPTVATESGKQKRKRKATSGKSQDHLVPAELTLVDAPSCPTWENSDEADDEKKMNNESSLNAERSETKEAYVSHSNEAACGSKESILDPAVCGHIAINAFSPTVGTRSGKRKHKHRATSGKCPEHVVPAELTLVVDAPLCSTRENSDDPDHEKKMSNESFFNAEKFEKKESNLDPAPVVHGYTAMNSLSPTVATESGKRKRKRRAASGKSYEHVEPAEVTPIVVDAPPCSIRGNSDEVDHEKRMNGENSYNAKISDKKEVYAYHSNGVACDYKENGLDAAVNGHIALDFSSCNPGKVLCEKKMDGENFVNATKTEKKETIRAVCENGENSVEPALHDGHIAMDASIETMSKSEEVAYEIK